MHCTFVTGRKARMDVGALRRLIQHPLSVTMVLAGLVVMIFIHPYEPIRDLPPHLAVFFWAQGTALLFLLDGGLAWVSKRTGRGYVSPLAMTIFAAVATLAGEVFLRIALGVAATPAELLEGFVLLLVLTLGVEFLVVVFVLDRILAPEAEAEAAEAMAAPAPEALPQAAVALPPVPDRIELRGEVFAPDDLLAVSSEEHYLRVVTRGRTRFLRGRMSDVEDALPARIGLRIHRSHWVAAQAVEGLKRRPAGWTVALTGGQEVPVARARVPAVRAWIAGLGDAANAPGRPEPEARPER